MEEVNLEISEENKTKIEFSELKAAVESIIFVSEEPISKKQLASIFETEGITSEDISGCITAIKEESSCKTDRGLQLVEVAGGYQFRTKEQCNKWIQKLSVPKPVRLSQPSLETLSIIAYRQPIIRSEIEEIRGVDVGGVLKTLLERNLICILGRRDDVGQPLIYGTTQAFLELFSLNGLKDLPPLTDIEELARRRVEEENRAESSEEKAASIETPDDFDQEDEDNFDDEIVDALRDEDYYILGDIENSIKDLRKLEREIFPKEKSDETNTEAPQSQDGQPQGTQENTQLEAESTEDAKEQNADNVYLESEDEAPETTGTNY